MPRPTYRPTYRPTVGLGYSARAAQRKAQARARLALGLLAVALPAGVALWLLPAMVAMAQALAASLALPLGH